MKKVVLWPNPERDLGFTVSLRAAALCAERGVSVVMPAQLASGLCNTPHILVCPMDEALQGADCLLALGGDGTILHLAKWAAIRRIPVLGVNLGRLGFMAELEAHEVPLLGEALEGRYRTDERMMLSLTVFSEGEKVHEDLALNDTVVTGGGSSRFLSLLVQADGKDMMSFMGDGVIVASPTGSTAYSMAAGGPIVEPYADSLAVTPVCAHMTHVRPMVLSGASAVTLRVVSDKQAVILTDGMAEYPLCPGDAAVVTRSDKKLTLIRVKPYNFYEALNRKLQI